MSVRQSPESDRGKDVSRTSPASASDVDQHSANAFPARHPRTGGHLTPSMVLGMQSLYGNRYVQRAIAAQRVAASPQIQRDEDDGGSGGGYAGDSGFYGSTDQGGGDFGGDAGFYGSGDQSRGDAWGGSGFNDSTDEGSGWASEAQTGEGGNASGDSATSPNGDKATDPNSGDSNSWQSEEGVAKQDASASASTLIDASLAEAQAQSDLVAAEKTGDSAATQDALQNVLAAMVNKMEAGENMSSAVGKLNQIQQGNKGQWSSG